MNTVLNYLAISALTTAAATAVAMGEPAMLEVAMARVGMMLGNQTEDSVVAVTSLKTTDSERNLSQVHVHSLLALRRY